MYYAVVEFKSNDSHKELAVVPIIWLIHHESRCYWPTRTKRVPLSIFVKACNPPSKNWSHYPVYKVHLKTINYDVAEKEVDRLIEEYEKLNALSTESNQSIGRKSIRHESNHDDEISNSSSNDELLTPKRQKMNEKEKIGVESGTTGESIPGSVQPSTSRNNFYELQTPSASSTSTMTLDSTFAEALDQNILFDNGANILSGVMHETIAGSVGSSNSHFQETILTSLAKLQTTNDQILLTMQEILRYNKKLTLEKLIAPENLPYFPLKTYEEFLNFEQLAKDDPIIHQYMIRRLAALGGSGIEGVTRRIMKYLMANQLGIQFNWKGRCNKIGLENTTTMKIVLEAAKLNFPVNEKNDLQVAWTVKEWLKHSAARMKKTR